MNMQIDPEALLMFPENKEKAQAIIKEKAQAILSEGGAGVNKSDTDISPKSRLVALLLCFFLGGFGVHRFYVGKIGTGILMLLTLGGLGIWWVIDTIFTLVGSFEDKAGRRVFRWTESGSV